MGETSTDGGRASTAPCFPFRHRVTSLEELRELTGTPGELAVRKELSALDAHGRTFIAHAPFVLVGTAGASGRVDVSPRGDAPGFALVLDDHTVVIPDRPGNRRVDSFQNVLENPHAGLLFVIPGVEETLRVNGRATLVRDPDLLERMRAQGKTPLLALAVHVEEAFLQCAKALRRSQLWQPTTWPDRSILPSGGQIWLDQTKPANTTAEELDCRIEASYVTNLY
jgi:PPOX class probable FMN-dependent enzyme